MPFFLPKNGRSNPAVQTKTQHMKQCYIVNPPDRWLHPKQETFSEALLAGMAWLGAVIGTWMLAVMMAPVK